MGQLIINTVATLYESVRQRQAAYLLSGVGRFCEYVDAEDLRSEGVPLPGGWQARVDEYLGPQGIGFVLWLAYDGEECALQCGPEGWRGFGWRPIQADEEQQ